MRRTWLWANAGVTGLACLDWIAVKADALDLIANGSRMHTWVQGFGACGPALIVLLQAAVVPTSPISAAGSTFGEVWGLVYVMAAGRRLEP